MSPDVGPSLISTFIVACGHGITSLNHEVDELCAQLAENTLRVYGSFAD